MGVSTRGPAGYATPGSNDPPRLQRKLTIILKDGTEVPITSQRQLEGILASMTPDELADWMADYRFTPIRNATGKSWYSGQLRDLM